MEIYKTVVLSTAHLTQKEITEASVVDLDLPRCETHSYGMMVTVHGYDLDCLDEKSKELFPNLVKIIKWAVKKGFGYIDFDRDGPTERSLFKTFE